MTQPFVLAILAVFLWWFFTGIIMLAVRWADRAGGAAHGMVTFAAVPVLSLGAAGVILSLPGGSEWMVLAGFLGALAVWGWVELAFLTGIVAGPERRDCPPGLQGWPRFWRAWDTVSHHEVALALGLAGIAAACATAENRIALWTYGILYLARVLAKLNLFLGVPRINVEFVPAQLAHIKTYFRRGPVTLAFPVAITFLSLTTGFLAERLMSATNQADRAALTLLVALSALALLEHWLMVVPLPDAKLWRWMLPAPKAETEKITTDERQGP